MTMIISFNGNSSFAKKDQDFADKWTIYGYDLPFIVKMSNIQGLIPVNHKQGKQTAFF